ncbi:tetratricopeptide repeat protein [Telmatobacter sp. DSM 110680]|uniref:Tetratricopeptide repeat protein n=1 Tax=Telmatobacter sp. DSM 110680 TaxID=3036704 RepID=A0AAU7DPA5_9BACT
MNSFSRQDVLRILQISSRQLLGWEKAGLISQREIYTFQDLGQLRTLRSLREDDVSSASIRHSVAAMQAVAGMSNPLQEASLVRTGTRLAFRCDGAMVDPIRRQLLFDFERVERQTATSEVRALRRASDGIKGIQELFVAAVQAEETGEKHRAISLYEEMLRVDPDYAPGYINLGTIHFHLRQFVRAEELYRQATEKDPGYVLAFFDLGNVLDELERPDESIAAYQRAVELAPRYADAHYNLALAYERKGERRAALRHWQAYAKLDKSGPWSEHARTQIRKLLDGEKLSISWRAASYIAPVKGMADLQVLQRLN